MVVSAPLLVVQNEPTCPPGWVGQWLTATGVPLHVCQPYAGDLLPSDLGGHAGLLVLGGHMGANEDARYPWLAATKRLVREAAAKQRPALGICLGHQVFAVALGGTVETNPAGRRAGVWRVGWLPAAGTDPLASVGGATCVQWNDDVVSRLPTYAVALARNEFDELQAARFAPTVWGVQWHPEAGSAICAGWAARASQTSPERTETYAVVLTDIAAAEATLQAAWRPLIEAFAVLLDPV